MKYRVMGGADFQVSEIDLSCSNVDGLMVQNIITRVRR